MKRIEKIFNTKRLPLTNMDDDVLKQDIQNRVLVDFSVVGRILDYIRSCDINMHSSPAICNLLTSYSHWMSGGEFTLPYPGTKAVSFVKNGLGAVLGVVPSSNAKTYYKLFYNKEIRKKPSYVSSSYTDYKGGIPFDINIGDQGFMNVEGYSYGILSNGPAFMRATPKSQIEFFDLDDSVRLTSYNFRQYTGYSDKISYTNDAKKISNDWYFSKDFSEYVGSIGNLYTFSIPKKYYKNISMDGAHFVNTGKEYILCNSNVNELEKIYNNYNPLEHSKNNENIPEVKEFKWEEDGKISQELSYIEHANSIYRKPFKTKEAKEKSIFHMREDGSICIVSKSGSTIELSSNGDIIISAKGNIKLNSGSSTSCIAGGDIDFLCRGNLTGRSTDKDIRFKSNNFHGTYKASNIFIEGNSYHQSKYSFLYSDANYIKSDIYSIGNVIYNNFKYQYNLGTMLSTSVDSIFSNGKNYLCTVSNNYAIKHKKYFCDGESFAINSSSTGVINCLKPVRVNHVHKIGQDKFTYSKTKLLKIETPPVGFNKFNPKHPESLKINFPDYEPINFTKSWMEKDNFYVTPWQTKSKSNWNVEEENLFPKGHNLLHYNGVSFAPTPWSSYPI